MVPEPWVQPDPISFGFGWILKKRIMVPIGFVFIEFSRLWFLMVFDWVQIGSNNGPILVPKWIQLKKREIILHFFFLRPNWFSLFKISLVENM